MYCCLQEQAWSDKIRRASTWWTWGLMGLHFASFVAVYTFLEPRKRQALTDAVSTMLQQHTARIDTMLSHVADAVPTVTAQAVSEATHRSATDRKQQQQLAAQAGQQGLAAAAEVQQKVLQQLESVQQQLQALTHAQQQQGQQQQGQQQQGQQPLAQAGNKERSDVVLIAS
jgi:sensitive to high expression protein 9